MGTTPFLDGLFETARAEFLAKLSKLPNSQRYQISKADTIDDVYDTAMQMQKEQEDTKMLAALKRIGPFMNGVKEYFGVIETFAQVKPEITCIIWGTLKLILQFANSLATAFQKLAALLSDIGNTLPNFKKYLQTGVFDNNDQVKRIMTLFYHDILDLLIEMLGFFGHRGLRLALETVWPTFRTKIDKIQENIGKHQSLMTSNVTFEQFLQALEHRQLLLKEIDEQRKLRISTALNEFREVLSSPSCMSRFQTSMEDITRGSGDWLFQDPEFMDWHRSVPTDQRCLCVLGIAGSGKTTLSARIIQKLQTDGDIVLFSFLSHDRQTLGGSIPMLHSLLFQALVRHRTSVLAIHEAYNADRQKFNGDVDYNTDLFCRVVEDSGPVYVIVDGLDEIEECRRRPLLRTLLKVVDLCGNVKLLISSRKEHDILEICCSRAVSLVLNERNSKDIEQYVQQQGEEWTDELRSYGADQADCNEVRNELQKIVIKSEGMFLYAKLVIGIARSQVDLEGIHHELNNLPEGLEQVYGRVLSRIRRNPQASKVLQWLACAKVPLTELELCQALLIRPSMSDFSGGQRTAFLNLRQACGPIIEIQDGTVRFAHFTAYEYFFGQQSNHFLTHRDGHLEALRVSVTYLCFSGFDGIFSPEAESMNASLLRERILAGDFILFRYAAQFWLEHAQALGRTDGQITDILWDGLARFYRNRGQRAKDKDLVLNIRPFFTEFQSFNANPTIQQALSSSARFQHRLKYGNLSPEDNWMMEDPTLMSRGLQNFQSFLESMIQNCEKSHHTHECQCEKLKKMYGVSIFRCKWPLCNSTNSGFTLASERSQHEKLAHRGRFICSEESCFYHNFGFPTSGLLARHKSTVHVRRTQIPGSSEELERLSTEDLLTVLEVAVFEDQIERTIDILKLITKRQEMEKLDFNLLLQLAAWKSRTCMVETLMPFLQNSTREARIQQILMNAICIAVRQSNCTTVRALLALGVDLTIKRSPHTHKKLVNVYFPPRMVFHWANVDTTKTLEHKLFDAAAQGGCNEVFDILFSFGAKPPHKSTFSDIIDTTLRRRLDLPAFSARWAKFITDPEYFDCHDLEIAIYRHKPAHLELCLQNGADPNRKCIQLHDDCSLAPLEYCIYNIKLKYHNEFWRRVYSTEFEDTIDMMSVLIQYGANNPANAAFKGTDVLTNTDPADTDATDTDATDTDATDIDATEAKAKDARAKRTKEMILEGISVVEAYIGKSWDEIFQALQAGQDLEQYVKDDSSNSEKST